MAIEKALSVPELRVGVGFPPSLPLAPSSANVGSHSAFAPSQHCRAALPCLHAVEAEGSTNLLETRFKEPGVQNAWESYAALRHLVV